jgi:hypothetical protein
VLEAGLRRSGVEAFRDSRGRRWSLSAYAEMAATTSRREAQTMGTLNRLAENGIDLVRVSAHSGSCEICKPYQGKVYSISGTHPRYPALREAPPYHPHCSHVLTGVVEGLSEGV